MTAELEKAQGLLASGDVPGLLRHLHAHGEALPLVEVARLVAGAARLAEFDDLAQAAAAVAEGEDGSGTQDARALYDFGYACIERGVAYLAVRPLARALELAPDAAPVLSELIAALEQNGQHALAVTVLEEHESVMQWLHRFQHVYNALMAGNLEKAAEGFGRLPEPEDVAWTPLREKVRRMLARANVAGFGLPATDFDPGKPAAHSLVVAYDLTETDPDAVAALHERAPGQILFERATCWTDPPRATADISGLLGQTVIPPWAAQIRRLDDGAVGQGPADDRPIEAVAAEILHAPPEQHEGDGETPPDPDEGLRRFVEAVTSADACERDGGWLGGIREYTPGAGPVPSSRFL